jgi:hypothetical protein
MSERISVASLRCIRRLKSAATTSGVDGYDYHCKRSICPYNRDAVSRYLTVTTPAKYLQEKHKASLNIEKCVILFIMCCSIKTPSENNLHTIPSHTSDENTEEGKGTMHE